MNRYRLDAAPAAPDELAKVVAKHFEAAPVERYSRARFEHLDDVDAARAGENDTGVARVHEQVAAKVSTTDENGSWILASVVRYDATSDAYAVQDEDDQKILELPASRIRRLGVADDNLDELQKGERVVAIFPETTSFYRAMVSKAPKRGPGGSPPREVVLKFEDDEDDSGRTPHRRVSLRYVLRERPQAKAPRLPQTAPAAAAQEHGTPVGCRCPTDVASPQGRACPRSSGVPGDADAAARPGGATYSEKIAHAPRSCPTSTAIVYICASSSSTSTAELEARIDLRKTPVCVVRASLLNASSLDLPAADKNIFVLGLAHQLGASSFFYALLPVCAGRRGAGGIAGRACFAC